MHDVILLGIAFVSEGVAIPLLQVRPGFGERHLSVVRMLESSPAASLFPLSFLGAIILRLPSHPWFCTQWPSRGFGDFCSCASGFVEVIRMWMRIAGSFAHVETGYVLYNYYKLP